MTHEIRLEVHQHEMDDVYKDRARIPEAFRSGIKEGRICKIRVQNQSALLEVRGLQGATSAVIRLDDKTRLALQVHTGSDYLFRIRPVWWWGQFLWAWSASDSAARIAARLGLLGLVLGVIGVILGILPLIKN